MKYYLESGMPEYLEEEKRRTGMTKTKLVRKFLNEYRNVAEKRTRKRKRKKLPLVEFSFDTDFGVCQKTVRNAIRNAMSRKRVCVDHSAEIAALDAQIDGFFAAYRNVQYIEIKEK